MARITVLTKSINSQRFFGLFSFDLCYNEAKTHYYGWRRTRRHRGKRPLERPMMWREDAMNRDVEGFAVGGGSGGTIVWIHRHSRRISFPTLPLFGNFVVCRSDYLLRNSFRPNKHHITAMKYSKTRGSRHAHVVV